MGINYWSHLKGQEKVSSDRNFQFLCAILSLESFSLAFLDAAHPRYLFLFSNSLSVALSQEAEQM
jgi:hypothetical protein